MMILLHGKRSYDHSGFECNNENLGTATEKLLQLAFQLEESAGEAGVTEEDIDSQHTEEEATPLTPKEIKALRKLLKKKK